MKSLKDRLNPFNYISLSFQLFINYIFLFFLILLILVSTIFFSFFYLSKFNNIKDIDSERIYNNINEYGLQKAYELESFKNSSYIEIIDTSLTIIKEYNSPHKIGHSYSQNEFNRMTINRFLDFEFYYPEEEDTILLIAFPNLDRGLFFENAFNFTIGVFGLSLIIVLMIYSKVTSISIVKPISKLVKGVQNISKGNYDTKIEFKTKNELGILKDTINEMSEKIKKEITLRELSEKNRKKLILDISHDLKTPLTSIIGYAETLKKDGLLDDDSKDKYLDIIVSNSKRANVLIQDLFDLSKLESDDYELNLEKQDLSEFLRTFLIGYISELEENDMDFEFNIPENEVLFCFDSKKLDRALGNIITNSIKYSGKNSIFSISMQELNNFILISMSDNGKGISDDLKSNIFEPFVKSDPSRNSKIEGTGLGLAITKSIILKHGGSIDLDPSHKKGLGFIICLPK